MHGIGYFSLDDGHDLTPPMFSEEVDRPGVVDWTALASTPNEFVIERWATIFTKRFDDLALPDVYAVWSKLYTAQTQGVPFRFKTLGASRKTSVSVKNTPVKPPALKQKIPLPLELAFSDDMSLNNTCDPSQATTPTTPVMLAKMAFPMIPSMSDIMEEEEHIATAPPGQHMSANDPQPAATNNVHCFAANAMAAGTNEPQPSVADNAHHLTTNVMAVGVNNPAANAMAAGANEPIPPAAKDPQPSSADPMPAGTNDPQLPPADNTATGANEPLPPAAKDRQPSSADAMSTSVNNPAPPAANAMAAGTNEPIPPAAKDPQPSSADAMSTSANNPAPPAANAMAANENYVWFPAQNYRQHTAANAMDVDVMEANNHQPVTTNPMVEGATTPAAFSETVTGMEFENVNLWMQLGSTPTTSTAFTNTAFDSTNCWSPFLNTQNMAIPGAATWSSFMDPTLDGGAPFMPLWPSFASPNNAMFAPGWSPFIDPATIASSSAMGNVNPFTGPVHHQSLGVHTGGQPLPLRYGNGPIPGTNTSIPAPSTVIAPPPPQAPTVATTLTVTGANVESSLHTTASNPSTTDSGTSLSQDVSPPSSSTTATSVSMELKQSSLPAKRHSARLEARDSGFGDASHHEQPRCQNEQVEGQGGSSRPAKRRRKEGDTTQGKGIQEEQGTVHMEYTDSGTGGTRGGRGRGRGRGHGRGRGA